MESVVWDRIAIGVDVAAASSGPQQNAIAVDGVQAQDLYPCRVGTEKTLLHTVEFVKTKASLLLLSSRMYNLELHTTS